MKTGCANRSVLMSFSDKTAFFISSWHRVGVTCRAEILSAKTARLFVPLLIILFASPANTMAQTMAAGAGDGATASGGGMLQVLLGLGLVLAAMAGSAWLLRRMGSIQRGPAGAIKVIGGSAVGQRERVVLVEIGETWLVVGVAPGHVTALHSMPKSEIVSGTAGGAVAEDRFSSWFRQVMDKRDVEQNGR